MFDYRFEDAGEKGIFHQNERDEMAGAQRSRQPRIIIIHRATLLRS